MKTLFELKKDCCIEDLQLIHPCLLILLTRTILFCGEHNLPLKLTSIISNRDNIKTSSRTHQTGRAFDMSVRSKMWSGLMIHKFLFEINKYIEIAAISASDGKPRAAIYHNSGYGNHIHVQCRDTDIWKGRFHKI